MSSVETPPKPAPPVSRITPVRSPADRASPRRRHVGLFTSFLILVILPTLIGGTYLYTRAVDQFASTVGFSIRKEEFSSPVELFGGITDFGSSGSSDADILYEFIQGQEMVQILEDRIGLTQKYSQPEGDPVFSYKASGSIEDLIDYWQRMVRVIYDPSTELIEVRVLAFTAEDARLIATEIFDESARLINELSDIAQADTIEFARLEVERAVVRLKDARETMTAFRSRTQIVDPTADLQSQMGLLGNLEQQLAEALIEADLLRESTRSNDIRLTQADRRIAVIEGRISEERRKLGVGSLGGEATQGDYATVLSEFERITVDREFAEQTYISALAGYDQAQAEARRKSRYLAAYIKPTLAETAQYPKRLLLLSLGALFLLAGWAIGVLVYYSVRDRR